MPVTKLKNGQLPDTLSSKTIDNTNTLSTTLSNLSISGGTNGQVLSTNGSGTLSWINNDALYTSTITKSADETVSGTLTIQDDDELFFSADANSTYAINLELVMEKGSTVTNRILGGWSYPSGSTGQFSASGLQSAYSLISATAGMLPDYATTSTGPIFTMVLCVIKTSSTSGTIKFRWGLAQATTPSITVKKGSRMLVRKL
jgi:hypothetical protein